MISNNFFAQLVPLCFFLGACGVVSEETPETLRLEEGKYVFPTVMADLGYEEPSSYDGLKEVSQCDLAKEKAVSNYNAYMAALGKSQNLTIGIIGKTQFVKTSWCHYDMGNSSNFVVITITGTEQQIARDKEAGRVTSGPMFITFFDKNTEIIKWSY